MRIVWIVIAGLLALTPAVAQAETQFELRPFVGGYVPVGDQQDLFNNSLLLGAQGAVEVAERAHVVATFAYTSPEALSAAAPDDVRLYLYDVGGELFYNMPVASDWMLRPFLGAGVGGRTYDTRDHLETDFGGYFGAGTEFQLQRTAIRIEARDYLTSFDGLTGRESSATRSDLMIGLGVSYHW